MSEGRSIPPPRTLPKGCELLCENVFDDVPEDGNDELLKRREPTMLQKGKKLVAPPTETAKRYTLVLDLDETLVYARDGPLYARAYLKDFLHAIKDSFEVIVWTAGEREYAKNVLAEINEELIIQHLIYRNRNWFNEEDYTKDLKQLGRDMNYTIIVENTPDCVRANPENGIIVADFEVTPEEESSTSPPPQEEAIATVSRSGEPSSADGIPGKKRRTPIDKTLFFLRELLCSLVETGSTVPYFLAHCDQLSRQMVEVSDGNKIAIYYLGTRRRRRGSAHPNKEICDNRDTVLKGQILAADEDDTDESPKKRARRLE